MNGAAPRKRKLEKPTAKPSGRVARARREPRPSAAATAADAAHVAKSAAGIPAPAPSTALTPHPPRADLSLLLSIFVPPNGGDGVATDEDGSNTVLGEAAALSEGVADEDGGESDDAATEDHVASVRSWLEREGVVRNGGLLDVTIALLQTILEDQDGDGFAWLLQALPSARQRARLGRSILACTVCCNSAPRSVRLRM